MMFCAGVVLATWPDTTIRPSPIGPPPLPAPPAVPAVPLVPLAPPPLLPALPLAPLLPALPATPAVPTPASGLTDFRSSNLLTKLQPRHSPSAHSEAKRERM